MGMCTSLHAAQVYTCTAWACVHPCMQHRSTHAQHGHVYILACSTGLHMHSMGMCTSLHAVRVYTCTAWACVHPCMQYGSTHAQYGHVYILACSTGLHMHSMGMCTSLHAVRVYTCTAWACVHPCMQHRSTHAQYGHVYILACMFTTVTDTLTQSVVAMSTPGSVFVYGMRGEHSRGKYYYTQKCRRSTSHTHLKGF